MSARELREWQAYEKVEGPIGAERMDYLAAMLAERVTNMLRSSGKNESIKSFMPSWDPRDQKEEIRNGKPSESHDPARD
jgi:hypothetical protein